MKSRILLCLVAIVGVVLIAGCGVSLPTGTYKLTEMVSEGEKQDISSLDTYGLKVTLEIKENKKATLNLMDEKIELTYNNKNFTSKESSSEQTIPYTYKDKKITMEYNNNKMVFETE